MEYKAFVDESGNDPSQSHFVLAGHLASIDGWESFAEEWDAALESLRLKEWHTSEIEHALDPQFVDLAARRLAAIAREHALGAAACHARWGDIQAILDRRGRIMSCRPRLAKRSKAPHSLLFLHYCRGIERLCQARGIAVGDVSVLLAKHSQLSDREQRACLRIADHVGFASCSFDVPSTATPLQAADMLCWSYYRAVLSDQQSPRPLARYQSAWSGLTFAALDREALESLRVRVRIRLLPNADGAGPRPVARLSAEDVQELDWLMDEDEMEGPG